MRRTQEGFSIVISFSVPEARNQLLGKGIVYTARWKRRKKTGKDWANIKRNTKKIVDVFIEEIGAFDPVRLDKYVPESGFKTLWDWCEVIYSLNPSKYGGFVWLYKVTQVSQQLRTEGKQ